jgi:hypothetical protein
MGHSFGATDALEAQMLVEAKSRFRRTHIDLPEMLCGIAERERDEPAAAT